MVKLRSSTPGGNVMVPQPCTPPPEAETIIHAAYGRAAVDSALDGKLLVYPCARLLVDRVIRTTI
jgi:hypothetical protein